jgi:hypothetical protein
MDTAAVIADGRTYAPVRYLAEYFGYVVKWDGTTRMVCVDPAYISSLAIPHLRGIGPFIKATVEEVVSIKSSPQRLRR